MHNDQSVAAPSPGLAIATLGAITATLVVNTLSNIYPPVGKTSVKLPIRPWRGY
ncbi:MAG: hypothetical protein LVS60_16305 [Nodosilinea sp. LVE1205-7]